MATAAALKSIESLSGVDARMEALDRLEQLTDEAAAEIARHRSNRAAEARHPRLAQGRHRARPANGR